MTMPDASVPTISVIVVSQGRPDALALCLLSLSQQLDAPDFEVIVVGDDDAHKASLQYPAITFVLDETPNISILRNVGINHASGDVLAFIDDDAVAGPFWLQQLFNAFDGDQISCVGGHVFGPDGVTLQWPDRIIHTDGSCTSFEPDDPKCVYAPKDRALKLEGTNMAFRRSVFEVVGLFDPSFAFYLDETDLCWRSYQAGLKSRINPAAWVVHGYEKGPRRNAERIPKSLYALGFSLAVFLRKHKPADCHLAIFDEFRAEQRVRVLRWMVRGGIETGDVQRLVNTLENGWQHGRVVQVVRNTLAADRAKFKPQVFPFRYNSNDVAILTDSRLRSRKRLKQASLLVNLKTVELYLFGISYRRAQRRMLASGVWLNTRPIGFKGFRWGGIDSNKATKL